MISKKNVIELFSVLFISLTKAFNVVVLPEFVLPVTKINPLGFSAVFITGNPDYYEKFGFESASKYGVHLQGVPATEEAPFFMVRTLKEDVLKDIEGYFVFDECYNVDQDDVDEFDKNFEPKKKRSKRSYFL